MPRDGGASPACPTYPPVERPGGDRWLRRAWLPIPLFLFAIAVLKAVDWSPPYELPTLRLVLNVVFVTVANFAAGYLLIRRFLTDRQPMLLLLACGALIWGCAGVIASHPGLLGTPRLDPNLHITVYNLAAWWSALFCLAGALARNAQPVLAPAAWAGAAAGAALAGLALVWQLSVWRWLPLFFVPGEGGTAVRQLVLGSAIVLLVLGGAALLGAKRAAAFHAWYGHGLLLLAVGLLGVMLQTVTGSPLNWTGRAAQYAGGAYIVMAALSLIRGGTAASAERAAEGQWLRYAVAVALVVAALALRMAFLTRLGFQYPFITYYPAVLLAAVYGGFGPGMLAMALSGSLAYELTLRPPAGPSGEFDAALFGVFAAASVLMSWLASRTRAAQDRAHAAEARQRERLEERVRERTEQLQREVAERRQTEEALRLTTERFEAALKSSPVVVFNQDRDLRYTWIHNPSLGLRAEDFIGMTDADLFERAEDVEALTRVKRAVLDSGAGCRTEVKVRDRGVERCYNLVVEPLRDAGGGIAGVTCAAIDITEQKAAERGLRAASARLEAVMNTAQVGILVAEDLECGEVKPNAHAQVLLGLQGETNLAEAMRSSSPPFRARRGGKDVSCDELPLYRAARSGEPVVGMKLELLRADGSASHVICSAAPLRNDTGAVGGAVCTLTDVTALNRAEERLREADRRKDEFLATLAHELRNPLAPVRTGLEVMRKGVDEKRRAQVQAMMERQVRHMVRLIDDLLDVSRITTGKLHLKRERIDLVEVLREAAEGIEPALGALDHRFTVSLPASPLYVVGDAARLSQVAANLLSNAVKYTPEGGQITLSAGQEGVQAVFRVRDNGIGIPADQLESIFDLFIQVHRGRGHGEAGLGIGLNLVSRLVEMHGGHVHAASAGPQQGSEFVVRLPLASAAHASSAASPPG